MRSGLFIYIAISCLLTFTVSIFAETESEGCRSLKQFQQANPAAQFHGQQYFDGEGFFEQVGTSDMIYGTVLSTGDSPINSARKLSDQIQGIYVREIGELVPAKQANGTPIQGVMWDKKTQDHRFFVTRFNQTLSNIPVFRSGIGFLIRNEAGFPVVMASNNFKELTGFSVDKELLPTVEKVTQPMIDHARKAIVSSHIGHDDLQTDSVLEGNLQRQLAMPVQTSEQQVVIWAGVSNVRVAQPELAMAFVVERGTIVEFDDYRKYLIVAALDDGEVLYSENLVSALDVDGTISGQASDGMAALECHDLASFALPYAYVEVVDGESVFANSNGEFNIPDDTNGPVTVRSELRGEFFDLFDAGAGNTTPSISVNVVDPATVDLLHNPNGTQFQTADVNCYLHANIVRDFVLSFEPNFPVINNQTGFNINVNINSTCNATYSGDAINFFRNGGGCNNTAIPSVIYHEYGHHLVAVTGNGQGQFGEGSGDTIGVLVEDVPEGGLGFFGDCDVPGRSAENFRSFPCSGGSHDCGQLLSGCVWDTVNEIRAIDPENARDITAELFVGMLIVRGQMQPGSSTIGPEITLIFLELDDDDANIGNGTPHYQQIAAAFNAHNMMAPELDALDISFPNGLPQQIDPAGGTELAVQVTEISSPPVPGTGILHVDRGNGFEQFPLTSNGADSYTATFPSADCGFVQFYVSFEAESGEVVTRPGDAPSSSFEAFSAVGIIVDFVDSFETDTGWSVSGDAFDGQWERAIPNNGTRGDPAADAEDAGLGFCFVTDNGNTVDTNTDVDGGSTTLTSPVFDAVSGGNIPVVSYFRWYNNAFGASPFEDQFVVEISNDGGTNWSNLETVGPSGPEVQGGWILKQNSVSDFVTPTNDMRIRFIASDLGNGSVVEAGVDAFKVSFIDCKSDVLHGDVNLDGVVDLLDVAPFVEILNNGGFQPEADVNKDGIVSLLDVQEFVDLINGN